MKGYQVNRKTLSALEIKVELLIDGINIEASYAGRIFERGKVRSMFVSGLESKDSFLKGAEYLASKNVLAFPMPWTPNPGSKLEGHRTPQPSWHLDLSRNLVDIWQQYDYTADHLKKLPLSRNYLYFDEMAGRT